MYLNCTCSTGCDCSSTANHDHSVKIVAISLQVWLTTTLHIDWKLMVRGSRPPRTTITYHTAWVHYSHHSYRGCNQRLKKDILRVTKQHYVDYEPKSGWGVINHKWRKHVEEVLKRELVELLAGGMRQLENRRNRRRNAPHVHAQTIPCQLGRNSVQCAFKRMRRFSIPSGMSLVAM